MSSHPFDPSNEAQELAAPSRAVTAASNGIVEIEQQRAIADTQAAMILAKRFPRNVDDAFKRVIEACKRVGLAEQAVYEYARGGTAITGPSIRLAEAIAQAWWNLHFGIRELSQQNGESVVEAFAWDVESNTRQVKVFQVAHKRHTRGGGYKLTDPRDIYELVANNGARRLRACILGTIPGDIIEAAVKQCEKTMLNNVDLSPEGVDKIIVAFERFDVNRAMIEARIQRKIEAISARNVLSLRRVFNALVDGIGKVEDYFDEKLISKGSAAPRTEERSEIAKPRSSTKKAAEPAQAETKSSPAPEEVKQHDLSDIPAHFRGQEDASTGALTEEELQSESPKSTVSKKQANINFGD